MPANVEIKARLHDRGSMLEKIAALTAAAAVVLEQEDTFFRCSRGRLKLRAFPDGSGELIFYQRPDTAVSRESHYEISRISDAATLRTVLAAALGGMQTVTKTRLLFHVGQTRIHVDTVAGLGDFLELEVVLAPGQPPSEGHRIAASLMEQLGIVPGDLLETAYADMLSAGGCTASRPAADVC
jgi:predicted adenylyl cyclase CyaB